jgi:hypothetical protein
VPAEDRYSLRAKCLELFDDSPDASGVHVRHIDKSESVTRRSGICQSANTYGLEDDAGLTGENVNLGAKHQIAGDHEDT